MTEKSHVAMEHNVCLVCGMPFETGTILMENRIKDGEVMQTLDPKQITGWGLCPDHKALHDQGYIAMVAIDPKRSNPGPDGVNPESVYRTGTVLHIKEEAFVDVFHTEDARNKEGDLNPVVFAEPEVLEKLKGMAEKVEGMTDGDIPSTQV